jgi:hypothetical protein
MVHVSTVPGVVNEAKHERSVCVPVKSGDVLETFRAVSAFGPILKATSLGNTLVIEFVSKHVANTVLAAFPGSVAVQGKPNKPGQRQKTDVSWQGIGVVRVLWPKRVHHHVAYVDFGSTEAAKAALVRHFPLAKIDIPLKISPTTVVKFTNVDIKLNVQRLTQLRIDGIPNVVNEAEIRQALIVSFFFFSPHNTCLDYVNQECRFSLSPLL